MSEPINLFEKLQREAEDLLMALPVNGSGYGDGGEGDEPPQFGFPPRMIEAALRSLYGKNRLDMFLRVTHFIAAADAAGLNTCDLLFGVSPRAESFRAAFSKAPEPGSRIAIQRDGVQVTYTAGDVFTTSYRAMPKTVCAANIVCLFLGADDLMRRLEEVSGAAHDNDGLFAVAKNWANAFEAYIRKREGSGQEARAFREIINFMNKAFPGGGFTHRDVSSDHVLEFWMENALREDIDMTLYGTAHGTFSDFAVAYAAYAARQAGRQAGSTSASIEEGGVWDETLAEEGRTTETSSYEDWLSLNEENESIKFLLGREHKQGAPVADLAPEAETLLLSALRAVVFGEVENKLVQVKRGKKPSRSKAEAVLSAGPSMTYEDVAALFQEIVSGFETAILASAHVLAANQREDGVRLLMAMVPELQEEGRMMEIVAHYDLSHDDLRDDPFAALAACLYADIASGAEPPAPFAGAFRKAESAWRSNERAGFRRNQIHKAEVVDAFEMASNRLPQAQLHLCSRLRKLKTVLDKAQKEPDRFGKDKAAFDGMFFKMHLSPMDEGVSK